MGELCKRTEEWRVNDEAEAKSLIEKAKADENVEGYELKMKELKIDRHTIAKRIKDGKEFKGYTFKGGIYQ